MFLAMPKIDSSSQIAQPHVIIGKPVTIWCKVTGYPMPIIKWLKDGKEQNVMNRADIQVLENGQGLMILETKEEHAGIWICEAENNAGKNQLDITLDVWTPPVVAISPNDTLRALDTPITLYCEATGNPEPSLSWSKEGQPLISSVEGARISLKGKRLDIPRLRQSHVGEYSCIATNEAGRAEAVVHIDVLVPPIINRDNIEMSPRLPTGQTLTLLCDATGKPKPTIQWYANDTLIVNGKNNVIIDNENRYIQISNISLPDHGIYKCSASNIAGYDELLYTVSIVQSPWIGNGGTVQTVEGDITKMICDAYGEPPPVVTWQRNGIRVESGVRYIIEDKLLKILDTRTSDSGIYVCIATNEAGTSQQAFTLEVLVVPRITMTSPNDSVVPVGEPFSLKCGARGYPVPDIDWMVNDKLIDAENEGFSVAEDGTLFIKGIQEQMNLKLVCTAKNDAGEDKKEYMVKIIGPPVVTKRGIKIINATEGDASLLVCEVEGLTPQIRWYKDGSPLSIESNMEFNEDRTELKIHASRLHDEGTYDCIAMNPAGNATQNLLLYVGVPPRITEKPRRIIVKSGQTAKLWCEAVGIPKPHITWLKDDQALEQAILDEYSDILKSVAVFPNITSEDAGVYTCKAENWAGTSYKDVDLVVLIPPTISPERLNVTGEIYDTVILPCNASGIPEPVVSWIKMPNVNIVSNGEKYQILGSSLAIRNIAAEDDGFYHCVAKSNAGQAIGSRRLIVIVPETDFKVIWVECDGRGIPVRTTYIAARGDMPESDHNLLPWKQEYQDLPVNGTDGTLIRCLPGVREPRHTISGIAPRFIHTPQSQSVPIGSIVDLYCSAVGSPIPEIRWRWNNKTIDEETNTNGFSKLRLVLDNHEDSGEYACVADNAMGSITASVQITIIAP